MLEQFSSNYTNIRVALEYNCVITIESSDNDAITRVVLMYLD